MESATMSYYRDHNNNGYFYHYTSAQNAQTILYDKYIQPTEFRTGFGRGVFLTELPPSAGDNQILHNNYSGNQKYADRTEVAIAVPKNSVNAFQLRNEPNRDVWKANHGVDLSNVNYKVYRRY